MKAKHGRSDYDGVWQAYLKQREGLKSDKFVRKLVKRLPVGATVLDLGCGAGWPVDDILLDAGYRVIGLDLSPRMIAQAKINCPGGVYQVQDILNLKPNEYQVEAVVSLYTFFHLPREKQGKVLRIVNSFLPSGGSILVSFGDREYEGITTYLGQEMWWSQWAPKKNREMVTEAGYVIDRDEMDRTGGETHHVILGRKIG